MLNMHMMPFLVKLPEETMQSTVPAMPPELSNRVVVLLSDEMLKALDEWRWENRISSRGEAIRQLVERGLVEPPEKKPASGPRTASSRG
jgi:hypothetical protein